MLTSKGLPSSLKHPLRNREILLCEDCVDQGRLYLKFLQLAGAEVTLECNGQSAVDAARRSPQRFDAIVLDFQMPEMDGLSATRHLRALGFTGAIIAVTGYGTEELERAWRAAGCDTFLRKPLTKHDLITAARQCLPSLTTALG